MMLSFLWGKKRESVIDVNVMGTSITTNGVTAVTIRVRGTRPITRTILCHDFQGNANQIIYISHLIAKSYCPK